MSAQPVGSCRVVYGDQPLPLLDGERFRGIDAAADCFALCVEGVEVDVGNYAEGGLRGIGLKLLELLVRESGFGDAARGGY